MKLAILSRNTKLYSTQRLVTAARERGHIVRVLDPLRCYMKIAPGRFNLNYKGKPLSGIDASKKRGPRVAGHASPAPQAWLITGKGSGWATLEEISTIRPSSAERRMPRATSTMWAPSRPDARCG